MEQGSKILFIDDDPNILKLVQLYLEKEGYQVVTATRGDEGLATFKKSLPQLVLLDIMMPGMDGWQVCRAIRQESNVPIIMLTAKDETFDKVLGLELGADDYVSKPFEPKELVARIKAVLRRSALSVSAQEEGQSVSYPGLKISLTQYEVHYADRLIEMPPKEIELLYFLASHPNMVFTREQLLEQVWDFNFFGDSRTVDVHIKRIREKLTDSEQYNWQIRTVWGVGYKFEVK
ncbi:MAG: response regulator transcription factor [Clostridiales bacterium]|nr:response regulator transcription factor [Clostridiales bacterium]